MQVVINGKKYKDIEKLTVGKLEHLVQLASHAIENYRRCYTDFDAELKKRPNIARHHQMLIDTRDTIRGLIHEQVDW